MSVSRSDLQKLLSEKKKIDNRMGMVDKENKLHHSSSIEQQIMLLQQRKQRLMHKIEELCKHQWGEPSYGYYQCAVCEKLRSTKHW